MNYKQKICVSHNQLPEDSEYFKEELIKEILTIPQQKPEMENVLDVIVWPEVVNVKLIDTEVGKSVEGQYLSGVKLVIELNIKEKVTYVACEPTQSIHAAHFETLKSIFVVVPKQINGKEMCDLIRADKVQVIPYIEAIKPRMLDSKTIYNCIMLFMDINFC